MLIFLLNYAYKDKLLDQFIHNMQNMALTNENVKENDMEFEPLAPETTTFLRRANVSTRSCIACLNSVDLRSNYTVKSLQKVQQKATTKKTESLRGYRPGGYMPAFIGQRIGPHKCYKLIRKLGYGTFSTVWLCKNSKRTDTYRAIKIIKASSDIKRSAIYESNVLKSIQSKNFKSIGHDKIIKYYTNFQTWSYNGPHVPCFETMGPSLRELILRSDHCGLEMNGVKTIIRQVLQGLYFLHEKCKLIHADIKPENILVVANDAYVQNMVDEVSSFEKFGLKLPNTYVNATESKQTACADQISRFEEPSEKASSCQNVPNNEKNKLIKLKLTPPKYTKMFVNPNIKVKISDLGNSCNVKNTYYMIQTVPYRALEVIIKSPYSYPVDIWSVACLTYELCTSDFLFNPYLPVDGNLSTAEKHLRLIWKIIGEIPLSIIRNGDISEEYFEPAGSFKRAFTSNLGHYSIENLLVDFYQWNRSDAKSLANFLEPLLDLDQVTRLTASSALECFWLKESHNSN